MRMSGPGRAGCTRGRQHRLHSSRGGGARVRRPALPASAPRGGEDEQAATTTTLGALASPDWKCQRAATLILMYAAKHGLPVYLHVVLHYLATVLALRYSVYRHTPRGVGKLGDIWSLLVGWTSS